MLQRTFSSCASLLLAACVLSSFARAAVASSYDRAAQICDGSQQNQGCSLLGRCDTTLLQCQCNPGLTGDGKTCESICMATNTSCNDNAVSCVDLPQSSSSYSCLCKEGYSWSVGGKACYDTDECAQRKCDPFSQCTNTEGSYECKCCYSNEGWEGIDGFGYVGDGKTKCYADSILWYNVSENPQFLNTKGYIYTKIPGGFPYFGKLYYDIYVHMDGLITFETATAPYLGGDSSPTAPFIKFIAPFWTNLDSSADESSGLWVDRYTLYSAGGSGKAAGPVYDMASIEKFFPKLRGWIDDISLPGFIPSQILTATWVNITAPLMPGANQRSRITFQATIVTNGSHSFGFQSYAENPRDTEWNVPINNVYVGFAGEDFATRYSFDKISQLYQDPVDVDNVCEKMTFLTQRGRWYKVFGPPFVDGNTNPQCLDEATRQLAKHGGFGLEPLKQPELYCPCNEEQAFADNRFILANLEKITESRNSCHLSRFYKEVTPNGNDDETYIARSYCCYDSKGALVTQGASAGAIVPDGYEIAMVTLKNKCCVDADLCDVFHSIYETVSCHGYERPKIAYVRGAGHFQTLGESEFQFNGKGEFTYFDLKNPGTALVQIRMVDQEYDSEKNDKTSFVTAMAVQCVVPPNLTADTGYIERKAEVRVNAQHKLEVLIDNEPVAIPVNPDEVKSMFIVRCDEQYCEIACKYQRYILSFRARLTNDYLRINATMPDFENDAVGLVGDQLGRLAYAEGEGDDVVSAYADPHNETQVRAFGEYWRTKADYSLFNYTTGETWNTYNDGGPDFSPTLWSEVSDLINVDNLGAVCHCDGDHACQYDQIVTGSRDISDATYEAGKGIKTERAAMKSRTPQWNLDRSMIISIHEDFVGSLSDFVKYDESNINLPEEEAQMMAPDGFEVTTDIFSWLYTLDEKSGNYTIMTTQSPESWRYNSFYVDMYAYKDTDGFVSRSLFSPYIFVCACAKKEQCRFDYADLGAVYRPSTIDKYFLLPCDCPPNTANRFCEGQVDVCANNPCDRHAQCTAIFDGYKCECNDGYSGNGLICQLDACPANHGCSQNCNRDPTTGQPVCSCNSGFMLAADGKTCTDRNECNFPNTCPDPKAICMNTIGSYYCECESGYKPMKGEQRWGCLKTSKTYHGSLEFEHYWDVTSRTWKGWDDDLAKRDSKLHQSVARLLEPWIEDLVKLAEPNKADFFTYINEFAKVDSKTMRVHFKFYPEKTINVDQIVSALKNYITSRGGEAAGMKGIVAAKTMIKELIFNDYCAAKSGCDAEFSTCQNGDDEQKCRCNPGFVLDTITSPSQTNCASYCFWKQCSTSSSHSCRDLAQVGPECLCKKGYALNTNGDCEKIDSCPANKNPCGENGICKDNNDGTFECSCKEGFVKANKPQPDVCVPDVMLCRGDNVHDIADGAFVEEYKGYYKIVVPVGFPYFDSKHWKVFVGPNGVMSLGKNVTASELASFHPNTYGYVIAPLWSDFVWDTSKTKIQVYDSTTSSPPNDKWMLIIETVKNATRVAQATYPAFLMTGVPRLKDPANFEPKTIVVVTWTDLLLKPFTTRDRATVQSVIASDGQATVIMWNYDASMTDIQTWEDPATEKDPVKAYPHRGFIGFQAGERKFCQNRVNFGDDDCRSFIPNQMMESKGRAALSPGRHVFLVANNEEYTTNGDRQCYDTLSKWSADAEGTDDLVAIHRALGTKLPDPCPWTQTQVDLDDRFQRLLGPRGKSCYSKKFSSPFEYDVANDTHVYSKTVNIRPYCCYRDNALLLQATSNTHMVIDEHLMLQSEIQSACCVRSAHCPLASAFVPAQYVMGYEAPVTAGVFGDPHMVTFAGLNVTFKGRGDYVLMNSAKISIQGRFNAMADGANGSALMGVAWKVGSHDKVTVEIGAEGELIFIRGDLLVNLTEGEFTRPFQFDTTGHIQSVLNFNETSVDSVRMTYADGLAFELLKLPTSSGASYLHLRIRMPKPYLAEDHSGLLADFIKPDGSPYRPQFYGTLFIGDKHYYQNYGKTWEVKATTVPTLFDTTAPSSDYVPEFFEDIIAEPPTDRPVFDKCYQSMPCAYDFRVTGDEAIAKATLLEAANINKRKVEEAEKPPTFSPTNAYVWLINVKAPYTEYTPTLLDPSPDVRFTLDTDFPRHLYSIDPLSGQMVVYMTEEAVDTFLNKGPFSFYMVATRGQSGASSYKPLAVRICNCLDERSCDFTDDRDAQYVGVIPSVNEQRYTIARCNCYPFQTGVYCDKTYRTCDVSPCYPGVPCFFVTTSSFDKPAFSCGGCPRGTTGNGFHCEVVDPCKNVNCTDGKVCQNINGYGVCNCPDFTIQNPDGSCRWADRCEQSPAVCTGDGQRCNTAPQGEHYCDCKPGYAPRYRKDSTLLDLQSCEQIRYTYVGSLTFNKFYGETKDLIDYYDDLAHPQTVGYQKFARQVMADLQNAASLLKSGINGIHIASIRRADINNIHFQNPKAFTVDFMAYSNDKLTASAIEKSMGLYYSQTNKVGVMVQIQEPTTNSTFIDICDSMHYSPCRNIMDISTCTQKGIYGEGASCTCNAALGYETSKLPSGDYTCRDACDTRCKSTDPKSKCDRKSPAEMYTCVCQSGNFFNETSKKCESIPSICTPGICGPNANCVPVDASKYECLCYPGYQKNETGACVSFCQRVDSCGSVSNAYGCQNLEDGYECLCTAGYRWNAVKKTCDNIDECAEGLYTCSKYATCIDTTGSYKCQCGNDYVNGDDAHKVCYAKKEKVMYPYNFEGKDPIQDSDEYQVFPVAGGFAYEGNFFHRVFVGFDGVVALDAIPPYKYFGQVLSTHLIAPFWMDLDVLPGDSKSGLYIDTFDSYNVYEPAVYDKWKEAFALAQGQLQTQYPLADNPGLVNNETVPMSMAIITWHKVVPAPASSFSNFHATFQLVFGANSGFSFAIFNYLENPQDINWPTALKAPELQPRIGYTIGVNDIRFSALNDDPPNFFAIFEPHPAGPQIRGRIVQAFGYPVEIETRKCFEEYLNYSPDISELMFNINLNPSSGVRRHLACPAFLKQMELDARWQPEVQVGENSLCYGGSFWNEVVDSVTNNKYNARSFCCYDMATGSYLTYPHHASSFIQIKEYRAQQEALFNPCCRNSPYCEFYSLRNPAGAIDPSLYDQPVIAYVRGDPHIGLPLHENDLANRQQLTFNGIGEYTLIKSLSVSDDYAPIEVQIRFSRRMEISQLATFITGIAILNNNKDKIEIIHYDGDIRLFVNGEEKLLSSIILPNTHDVVDVNSYDLWSGNDFIGFVTGSGLAFHIYEIDNAYFNIRVSMPDDLSNHDSRATCGLLTSMEEAPYLDCNGAQATGDINNNELDLYNFGLHFKTAKESDSLFSYKVGPSFAEVNTVPNGWVPKFLSDFTDPGPSDMSSVCGMDKGCQYDYHVTLDKKIASETKAFGDLLLTVQSYSLMGNPTITNDETNRALVMWLSTPGYIFEFDVDSKEEQANPPIADFHYEVMTNLPEGWYSFDSKTGVFQVNASIPLRDAVRQLSEAPYLRFAAVRGVTASLLTPIVWTCACETDEQCDFNYDNRPYYERDINEKHNYFMQCSCPATSRGKFCEYAFDTCSEKPCGPGITCNVDSTAPTGYTCGSCPPGYVSSGGSCKPKVCPVGTCTNGECYVDATDGSFKCACWKGYELTPGNDKVCRDINECALGTDDCYKYGAGHTCINTPGSYVCGCKYGYAPDSSVNFKSCVKVPHQVVSAIKVQSVIVNNDVVTWTAELADQSSALYKQTAQSLESSLLQWLRQDLQQTSVTSVTVNKLTQGSINVDYTANSNDAIEPTTLATQQQEFLNAGGSISGVVGPDPASISVVTNLCLVDNRCDLSSTECRWDDVFAIARCDCLLGFAENPKSDTSCTDNCTNICTSSLGANGRCVRSDSNYSCSCIPGTVQQGGVCVNPCDSNPCKNGATCAVKNDNFFCTCPKGFTGTTCAGCAEGYEPVAASNGCKSKCEGFNCGSGYCVLNGANPNCVCPTGVSGPTCNQCASGYDLKAGVCVSKCQDYKECGANGDCALKDGQPSCVCKKGYTGDKCQTAELTCTKDCGKNGKCALVDSQQTCKCNDGYQGSLCDQVIPQQPTCDKYCGKNGKCALVDNLQTCKCNDGYQGSLCDQVIPQQATCDKNCGSNGKCALVNGVATCKCNDGYQGEKCDQEVVLLSATNADQQNLIIIAAVLGSVCFILLCVVLGFACLVNKQKKGGSDEFEMKQQQSSVPEIEIRAPQTTQTAFGGNPAVVVVAKNQPPVQQAVASPYAQQPSVVVVSRPNNTPYSPAPSQGPSIYAVSAQPTYASAPQTYAQVPPAANSTALVAPVPPPQQPVYNDIDEQSEEF